MLENCLIGFLSPFFYPGFVALFVASLMFPPGLGQYMASSLGTAQYMQQLFSNFTWISTNLSIEEQQIVRQWSTDHSGIFCHLWIFVAFTVHYNHQYQKNTNFNF